MTVTGSTIAAYNGTKTITKFGVDSFGFPSTAGVDDALNANIKVGASDHEHHPSDLQRRA